MKLFLSGDVMTGRGIDQILPHPGDPALHEDYVRSARDYVAIAEKASGAIPEKVSWRYVWGDALAEIERRDPDARIINLETAITARGTPEPKGINYRMHPGNTGCITAAGIDCCVLANNHLGDWGLQGMIDTLATLKAVGVAAAGAGRDSALAAQPAILDTSGGRILVFGFGAPSSGVPLSWAALPDRPGVNLLPDFDDAAFRRISEDIHAWRRPGDAVVASIHWGPNWGYDIPDEHRRFAHALIDEAGVDIVHGHSSHHPMAIEVHAGRPVLYGCGDLINDYEGISGHEAFRPNLTLAWFVDYDRAARRLRGLEMVPFRLRKFRLERLHGKDAAWLADTLDRQCRRFGHRVGLTGAETLALIL
jgi:poly-gamma-glutamate capsule biosynthesis protein CapA/YwtB (metallophosphatase superfamily)